MNKHLEYTLKYFKEIDIDKVINVYFYGSHVYGCETEKSDYDYIIVYDQEIDEVDTIETKMCDLVLNASLYSPRKFQEMINLHRIDALECLFLREDWKYETMKFDFNLDLEQLRRTISAISSNSWVKTKKKINQGDNYIGKKSLFHSLRIADYGIQVAKEGKIVSYTKPYSDILDYETFKELLLEIMCFETWEELKEKYQNTANNLRTKFREVAPLEK
jgi:predicted nucleotidyltransferase